MAENEDARATEQVESNGDHEKTVEAQPLTEAEPMNQNGGEDKDDKTEPSAELDEVKDDDKQGTDLDTVRFSNPLSDICLRVATKVRQATDYLYTILFVQHRN